MAKTIFEELSKTGQDLIEQVKKLFEEGNIKRVKILSKTGKVLLDLPLNFGMIGLGGAAILHPLLTTIAGVILIAGDAKVIVEKEDPGGEVDAEIIDIDEENEEDRQAS